MTAPRPLVDPIVRRYRALLMKQGNEESALRMLKILEAQERRMLRSLAHIGENGVTKAAASRVSNTITRIALESEPGVRAWLHGEGSRAGLNGLGMQADVLKAQFGVTNWRDLPAENVRDTFLSWERAIKSGKLISVNDADLMAKWAPEFLKYSETTGRALQERFVEAAVNGESWKQISKSIVNDLGTMDLRGRMNPEAFADAFTRTKLTEFANEASIGASADAGIELFENQGVPDDAQSDECAEADTYGPITLAEWDASSVGRPPRHVFNCRCMLAAVVMSKAELEAVYA